jgi:hypothetical protein
MQKESWKESMVGRRREGAMRGLVGVALGAVRHGEGGCRKW